MRNPKSVVMFKNYIQVTFRNFKKSKFYSFINIIGLSLGITAIAFILLYINDELGYDKHFKNHESIYRLESNFTINNKHDMFAITSVPLGPAVKLEMPEVEAYARFISEENTLLKYNEKEFYEKEIFFADSSTPSMFSLEFIEGEAATSLQHPFSIILSESASKRYFGEDSGFGKTLLTGGGRSYKVTGIFKDLPQNTHMPFEILMSMESLATIAGGTFRSLNPGNFWNVQTYTFIQLKKPDQITSVLKQGPALYNKYMKSVGDQISASFEMMATRIDKIHLTSKLTGDFPTGNSKYLYIMGVVGIMIMILAAINYTNLATARATKRAREIGLRKVSGANRSQLASQFITESLVLSFIALIISFILIHLLLPFFNELANKQLNLRIIENADVYLIISGVALITGLLAGLYPALYLSSFQPANVLKGKVKIGKESGFLRKGLVTLQLTITVVMITGTIIIYNQLNFMRNADMGFEKENVMVLEIQDTAFLRHRLESFMNEIESNPNVILTSRSAALPGSNIGIRVMKVEKENKMQEYALNNIPCDFDLPELLKLEFIKGRPFDRKMGTDSAQAVIINEATAKALGWGDDALGKKIETDITLNGTIIPPRKVIGVVKDFNFKSLHNPIEPMIIYVAEFQLRTLSIKLREGYNQSTIDFIKQKWESFGANRPFDYYFLDERFASVYDSDAKLGKVFYTFATLSIFIALLGLLGLSSFITAQRTKEIGIRKVLGASAEGITGLLYKESLILVGIACLIAFPLSWYMLSNWLDNFAYHVNISWITITISTLTAVVVCLVSVSYHTISAANSNPIVSIKYE